MTLKCISSFYEGREGKLVETGSTAVLATCSSRRCFCTKYSGQYFGSMNNQIHRALFRKKEEEKERERTTTSTA